MSTVAHLLYLIAAVSFVVGLHQMGSPATARRGNLISAAGMALAIVVAAAVLVDDGTIGRTSLLVLVAGLTVGSVIGLLTAQRVHMTDMPQLVSLLNAVGGGAAALVAFVEVLRVRDFLAEAGVAHTLPTVLDVLIGALTFSGSLIAAGKLAGKVPGNPVTSKAGRIATLVLSAIAVVAGAVLLTGNGGTPLLVVVAVAALVLGVLVTLPIGGADMPVVISLLNACTGTAVAMAGFVLDSVVLVIAGALVGAAGAILTLLMAEAMNRSLVSILLGGYGTSDVHEAVAATGNIRETTVDDAGLQLAYANKVVVVPGYGLAAAQAQHELVALCSALESHGVEVSYGIHPVAGRMPGHMNVLLAEADVPTRSCATSRRSTRSSRGRTWCSSSAPTTSRTRPRAGPATRCPACRSSTSTAPAASSSSSARWAPTPASTTSSTPTPRRRCCSAMRRPGCASSSRPCRRTSASPSRSGSPAARGRPRPSGRWSTWHLGAARAAGGTWRCRRAARHRAGAP